MTRTGSIVGALLMCLVLPGGLGGCSVASLVGANSEPPPATHDLMVTGHPGIGFLPVQITVNEPSTVDALSTSRIVIKPGKNEVSYFSGAVWTDKLPRLLQLRMIEIFEKSRILKAVSSGSDRLRGDFGLAWQIRDFQVEVEGTHAVAHATFFVKLVDEDVGVQVSSAEFTATAPARDDSAEAGVEALTEAFSVASAKIMRWVVTRRIAVVAASH